MSFKMKQIAVVAWKILSIASDDSKQSGSLILSAYLPEVSVGSELKALLYLLRQCDLRTASHGPEPYVNILLDGGHCAL